MQIQIKTSFLLYMFMFSLCLNTLFLGNTDAQFITEPFGASAGPNYTFESIDVPGVDYLELTASSDFEDYAGNTRSADGQKIVGFTLIDGVFATYDFPDAVETEIYGMSDATGVLTGNFIDEAGVRRGFSGDIIVEAPDASATYADFVSAGRIVGSYIDAEGIYHPYIRTQDGRFTAFDSVTWFDPAYIFIHGINDVGVLVVRAKAVFDIPRTYVGKFTRLQELQFPGSVSTEGWNINQDGSVVGHYDSADGRRHGFIAKPATEADSHQFSNVYTVSLSKGLNMLSVALAPPAPMTAKSLVAMAGATTVIMFDAPHQRFVAWTPDAPDDGFSIEGGQGYIVNVPESRRFAFVGAPWTDPTEAVAAAPTARATEMPQEAWAFVVSGHLGGKPAFDGYKVIVRNLRTNSTITAPVRGDYFAAATADLERRSVIRVGDVVELRVIGPGGNVESQTRSFKVTPEDLANAVLSVRFDSIGQPTQNLLLQNYPNPFNPETWIPYQLSEDSPVSVSIYDTTGKVIRRLLLGYQSAGYYNSRGHAAYWDGKNAVGEPVASGVYFYTLTADDFSATRKMLIRK